MNGTIPYRTVSALYISQILGWKMVVVAIGRYSLKKKVQRNGEDNRTRGLYNTDNTNPENTPITRGKNMPNISGLTNIKIYILLSYQDFGDVD